MPEEATFTVKATDARTGEASYIKFPRPVWKGETDSLKKYFDLMAAHNPDFTPEQIAAHIADRLGEKKPYKGVQVAGKPWDAEVVYGEEGETAPKKNPSQRLVFRVLCVADCTAEIMFPQGTNLTDAMAYAKAHLHEIEHFQMPRTMRPFEVIEGSGHLEEDYPPWGQVVCVDGAFSADVRTAKCVRFSRQLTEEQAAAFRACLKEFAYPGGEANGETVRLAVQMFNATAKAKEWEVTAEVLEALEPWDRVMDYDAFSPFPGPSHCDTGSQREELAK